MKDSNRCPLFLLAVYLVMVVSGCAVGIPLPSAPDTRPAKAVQPLPAPAGNADSGWWAARFQFDWPEGTDPAWHLDTLIAHQVVAPVLKAFEARLPLWRFHRRAARDKTGHQFSFIFYGPRATAMEIFVLLQSDSRLNGLRQDGVVNRIIFSDTDHIDKPCIADTADRNWSVPVQRAWPHFMAGASRMWLELIEDIASGVDGGRVPEETAARRAFFRKVDEKLNRTWQEEGRHALLHHLNALFGYGPLVVYEKRYMQF